jgi:hypothetical protein
MVNCNKWEYRDLVYSAWEAADTWTCLTGNNHYAIRLAQDFFWQSHQDKIMALVTEWTKLGWEPIEEINAAHIKVSHTEHTESRIDEADVLSWILTFGLGLVIQLMLGLRRQYTEFSPVDFRLQMRRPEQYRLQVPTQPSLSAVVN